MPAPGHINHPSSKNNTAHFSSLFSCLYKEQVPNARVVKKLLLNEVLGGSRIIQYHGIHNQQAFQRPHGCVYDSLITCSPCETASWEAQLLP